ncbi:MAG: HD domain-containing protein [Treponema sp.]|nr:HD domain-containing protein [Treponema sp.]
MEFLRNHQLNIMLFLSGVCAVLTVLAFFTKSLSKKRRLVVGHLEAFSSILLLADRFAYIYRGDPSVLGWWMVRVCNFLVFLLSLLMVFVFNQYIKDLVYNEGKAKHRLVRLQCVDILCAVGIFYLVFSQFTGIYYTFDEMNFYHRAKGFPLSYFFPLLGLLLQFSVTLQYSKRFSKYIRYPLLLFSLTPMVATIAQVFTYGLSLTNITIVGTSTLIYVFVIIDLDKTVEAAKRREIEFLKQEQKNMHIMFEQTAEALANAIDAKDKYTHGHSSRVAEYSKKIAALSGKSEQECEEVYFAGLLHDVGKIGVPSSIINKDGKLTDEEFAEIKKHPLIGSQILSSITKSPYLAVGALYHHERYGGRGYPHGLKGEDIPDIARIIAVADAYDAMSSKRSYRDPIPQQKVREEIVKGMDTQFDPKYAKLMLQLIDHDSDYHMKEHDELKELAGKNELDCRVLKETASEGIQITRGYTRIHLHSQTDERFLSESSIPYFVIFDSLDAHIHTNEKKAKDMLYLEFATIRGDGDTVCKEARKIQKTVETYKSVPRKELLAAYKDGIDYDIEAVKYEDHLMVTVTTEFLQIREIIALNDSAHYAYLGLTGENCLITNVDIKKLDMKADEDTIPRIAEKLSYINVPQGDVPNIQIDNWCTASTIGIPLENELDISFHTRSLPTARLVWHCPFISIFYSADRVFRGDKYMEFAVLRLDGENWESYEYVDNKIYVNKLEDFESWDKWKEKNKNGYDCTVNLKRIGNTVTMTTTNCGISIKSITTIQTSVPEILISITGDQCAITDIRYKS